jgi:hypothetical protein
MGSKVKNKKTNPKRIPRTEADVEKAWERGRQDGARSALTIMLYTLRDKFGIDDAGLQDFAEAFNYTLDSMNRGYVTEKDLEVVLKEEYGTTLRIE